MEKKKRDNMYELYFKNKKTSYVDDTMFQGELNNVAPLDVPTISELSSYIEEFTEKLTSNVYHNDGVIVFNCGYMEFENNEVPLIKNDPTSSVFLEDQKTILYNVDGSTKFHIKYYLIMNISKPIEKIKKDLNKIEDLNVFFKLLELTKKQLNIKTNKELCVMIMGARFDLMPSEEWSFLLIEYYYLRRYMFATETQARIAIKKIYKDFVF